MWFVGIGCIFVIMKLMETMPVARWPWWQVVIPFGLALAWWAWSDASGRTARKNMERDIARKEKRRQQHLESIGLGKKSASRSTSGRQSRH